MEIDWQTPFVVAFEVFMFGLGWLLVALIVAFLVFFTYAIVKAIFRTIRGKAPEKPNKARGDLGAGIITFDKK